MKVYIAAPWIKGGDALEARTKIELAGHKVTSRWLERVKSNIDPTYDYMKDPTYTQRDGAEEAQKDMDDIYNSNVVILLNSAKSEGKVVETGIALGWQVPIIVVGERTNTFHYLPQVKVVETVEAAIEQLAL